MTQCYLRNWPEKQVCGGLSGFRHNNARRRPSHGLLSASKAEEAENAPVLTKAVEAPSALSKPLAAEDVDAMWAERCGSDSPASDEAAGGGGGGGVLMSGVKSMSSAAADGAALVTTGVASGLQAVFGEDIDKSDAGLEAAFAKKWMSHPRERGTIDAAEMKAYILSVYEDGLDDKTICAMMAGAPGTSTDGKLGIDDFKLIMRAGPKKAKRGGIGSAVTSAVDAGVDATVGGVKAIGDGAAFLGQKSLEGFGAIGDAIKANPLKAFGIGAAATGATVLAVVTAPVTLPAAAAVTVVVGAHATVAAAVGVGAAGAGAAVVVGTQHAAAAAPAADKVAAPQHAASGEHQFRQSGEHQFRQSGEHQFRQSDAPPTPPPRTGRPSRMAADGGADVAGVLGAAVGAHKASGDGAGAPHRDLGNELGNPPDVLDGL